MVFPACAKADSTDHSYGMSPSQNHNIIPAADPLVRHTCWEQCLRTQIHTMKGEHATVHRRVAMNSVFFHIDMETKTINYGVNTIILLKIILIVQRTPTLTYLDGSPFRSHSASEMIENIYVHQFP